jgi:hypothetical protein
VQEITYEDAIAEHSRLLLASTTAEGATALHEFKQKMIEMKIIIENKTATTAPTTTTAVIPGVDPTAAVLSSSQLKNRSRRDKHRELKSYVVGEYGINFVEVYLSVVGELESKVLKAEELSLPLGVAILQDSSEVCYVNVENLDVDVLVTFGIDVGVLESEVYTAERRSTVGAGDPGMRDIVRLILDSGASISMSSDPNRILKVTNDKRRINGVSGTTMATKVGENRDGVTELLVPDLPIDLVLLCLRDYAVKGGVWMDADGGAIYELSSSDKEKVASFMEQFPKFSRLNVINGIYELDQTGPASLQCVSDATSTDCFWSEVAFRASVYRNGVVSFDSVSSQILGLMMMGLSYKTIKSAVLNQSIGGVPPTITLRALSNFARNYGQTPDVIQQSLHHQPGNKEAFDFEYDRVKPKEPGDRVEVDQGTWDANERL